jgi:hypothetical protein
MALDLLNRDRIIQSVDQIRSHLKEIRGIDASKREVTDVIKNEMDMSFRKLRKISLHGNSTKNLILRQQFAVKFL